MCVHKFTCRPSYVEALPAGCGPYFGIFFNMSSIRQVFGNPCTDPLLKDQKITEVIHIHVINPSVTKKQYIEAISQMKSALSSVGLYSRPDVHL